jgi:uncharacterized cofD-like protein
VPHGEAPIRRVFLEPHDPPAYPEAVSAILGADLVILGPGSLYTSVLPNLLVPDIAAALAATAAPVVYVANVATQPGETDGYTLEDHIRALRRHLRDDVVDWVLANDNFDAQLPARWNVIYVRPEDPEGALSQIRSLALHDLVDESRLTRHDPAKLASAVMEQVRSNGNRVRRAA